MFDPLPQRFSLDSDLSVPSNVDMQPMDLPSLYQILLSEVITLATKWKFPKLLAHMLINYLFTQSAQEGQYYACWYKAQQYIGESFYMNYWQETYVSNCRSMNQRHSLNYTILDWHLMQLRTISLLFLLVDSTGPLRSVSGCVHHLCAQLTCFQFLAYPTIPCLAFGQ